MEQYDENSTTSEYLGSSEHGHDNIEFIKVDSIEDSDVEEIFTEENSLVSERSLISTRSINEDCNGPPYLPKFKKLYLKEEVVLTLINTIRRTPVLWKQNEPGYRDLGVQQEAWNSVAKQFGVPVEKLKEKWTLLRAQFRTNLNKMRYRRMKKGQEHVADYQPKWFAFEAMQFLRSSDENSNTKTSETANKTKAIVPPQDGSESGEDTAEQYPDGTGAFEVILNFINHVKEKPVLWDKTHPDYKSLTAQSRAWKTLEDRLQLPVADMKRKWQLLRVQFRNNLKKVKRLSTPNNVYEPTWFAFEAMQFIRKNHPSAVEEVDATPELNVTQPTKQTVTPKPSVPERTPIIKPIVREYKRPHPSPVPIPNKVQRTILCASTITTTTPSTSSANTSPASIRPTSYVTSGKVEPFIIRTFRNLSKITGQIAQQKTSPYSGLLDHLATVLGRKRDRDFQEIEGVLLKCLNELQKFPNARKEVVTDDTEMG